MLVAAILAAETQQQRKEMKRSSRSYSIHECFSMDAHRGKKKWNLARSSKMIISMC